VLKAIGSLIGDFEKIKSWFSTDDFERRLDLKLDNQKLELDREFNIKSKDIVDETIKISATNTSVAQHETDLNNLINTITSQGYQIITAPSGWGCYGCIANSGLRRIFFGIP
jgi:hypothetical protein